MYVTNYTDILVNLQSIARIPNIYKVLDTPMCMKNCKLPYLLFSFRIRKGKPGHLVEILLKGCIIFV